MLLFLSCIGLVYDVFYVDCVCLVTFVGWLKPWLARARGPRAFHIAGALEEQLRLKWVQARVS